MRIMTARVHDAAFHPGGRDAPRLRGIGQPGLLGDGQPVHVRADQHRWTGAIAQHGHHAGAPHLFGDDKSGLARRIGHDPRGTDFLKAQFGIGVEIAIDRQQVGHVCRNAPGQIVGIGMRR